MRNKTHSAGKNGAAALTAGVLRMEALRVLMLLTEPERAEILQPYTKSRRGNY